MPLVPFTFLPDESRVWVFGSPKSLGSEGESILLETVDQFLEGWKAHGQPLTAGRNWRERRFLTIAVDNSQSQASGCSIDGLFKELQGLEERLGVSMVGSGDIYYRDATGLIRSTDRASWIELAEKGEVNQSTVVFDFTVPTLGDWRKRFEVKAARSWHATLLPQPKATVSD